METCDCGKPITDGKRRKHGCLRCREIEAKYWGENGTKKKKSGLGIFAEPYSVGTGMTPRRYNNA